MSSCSGFIKSDLVKRGIHLAHDVLEDDWVVIEVIESLLLLLEEELDLTASYDSVAVQVYHSKPILQTG